MLQNLRFQNFKGFKDSKPFSIKPISIFIGANSSGKSSILHFLTMLKQTVESGSYDTPLIYQGKYIELGELKDVMHQRKESEKLIFEFRLNLDTLKNAIARRGGFDFLGRFKNEIIADNVYLKCVLKKLSSGRQKIQEYSIYSKKNGRYVSGINIKWKKREGHKNAKYRYVLDSDFEEIKKEIENENFSEKISDYFEGNYFYFDVKDSYPTQINREKEIESEIINDIFLLLQISANEVQRKIKKFHYISGLRSRPQRYYLYAGELPDDVGKTGENQMNALVVDKINRKNRIIKQLNKWLKEFGLLESIKVEKIHGISAYKISIVHTDKEVKLGLPDVGFGVSQILPILVESLYSTVGSTILIEQPEIHLHPKVQSLLANFFVELIKDRNKHFVIETHSEHLLLRLRNLILQKKVEAEKIGIYYVEKKQKESVIREVKIDKYGEFIDWPDGFFDTSYQDTLEYFKLRTNGNNS